MMKKGLAFLPLLLSLQLIAQFNLGFRETEQTLNFTIAGNSLDASCIGGLNNPQFSFIDLNLDGDEDLFIFDRSNDVIRTFLFNASTSAYSYAPEYERLFPQGLDQFVLLKDYNCDGKADIFTYFQAAFRVYQNTSTTELSFEKVTDKIRSNYGAFTSNAYVLAGDIPALVDVDNDGDLDILTFGTVNSENSIEFHRNLSQDLYNSCDSLVFEVPTQCWGKVQEPSNSSLLEAISCKGVVPPGGRGARHAGSTVLLIDPDNDGDKDLVIGDVQTNSLVFGLNIGDENEATIDVNQQTTDFPNAIDPATIDFLVAGYELDIDRDGKKDLVLSSNNSVDSSFNAGHVWYYRNNSAPLADYQLQSTDFIIGDMLDLGSNTDPETMDVNGDGRMDLLIAMDYLKSPTQNTKSRIYYFEQESNGSFTLVDDDFAGLSALQLVAVNITLGDMDGDGDQDLIAGDGSGALHYSENITIGGVSNFSLVQSNYMGINISYNASPDIADLNDDGLPDLLVGGLLGSVNFFENTGSETSAFFSSTPTIEKLGGIDVSAACCVGHAHPKFIENNAFGSDKYLFVGSDEKRIDVFKVNEDLSSNFARVDSLLFNAGRLTPCPADLDGNGIYEMLCGTGEGGLKYYTRTSNTPVGLTTASNYNSASFKAFPNPANSQLNIEFNKAVSGPLELIDVSGRSIFHSLIESQRQEQLNTQSLEQGIYILKFSSNDGVISKSISILH
jgi:hypothetical protein